MNYHKFFIVITLLIFIIAGCSKIENKNILGSSIQCNNCNVILIDLTALRADRLSSYGYPPNTTPNMDILASNSIVFKNAISASSWTLPSVMSVFTSAYPSEHGLKNNKIKNKDGNLVKANLKEMNRDITTLAEVLRQNNYATAGFTGDVHLNKTYGYGNGFDEYYGEKPFAGFETNVPLALDWLKENKNRKFFLFVQGYDLHGRYGLQKDSAKKFMDKGYNGLYTGSVDEQIYLRDLSLEEGHVNLSEEDMKFWRSLYDTKLYDADKRLGIFFNELEKSGVTGKSIIIIMGDHGDEIFERNRIDHGFSLYDELIHVPLIIRIPNLKHHKAIEGQVRTIDIMPTILDLISVDLNQSVKNQMKGESLVPLMQGRSMNLDAFSETDYLYKIFKRSIRKSNGWKFIYSLDTNQRELYNLNKDPKEKNNLVNEEPQKVYELEQELFKQIYG